MEADAGVTERPQRQQIAMSTLRTVRETCSREELFPSGSRALVMVSGGQDSVVLLELLAKGQVGASGPSGIVALHVNHHLRGQESVADEQLVRDHCARSGVGLVVVDGSVDKSAGNVQEEARMVRRRAALEVAAQRDCARIALGHTLDDQVETMLYRMARYGGLAAIRGMLPSDPPWVRPLLDVRRAETEAFCRERGLAFAVDRGNADPGYARTGVRECVLPAWERALPGAARAAARTAQVAAEAETLLRATLMSTGLDLEADGLDVRRLLSLPAAAQRLALHAWLEARVGMESTRSHVLALQRLAASTGSVSVDLGSDLRVVKEYDLLFVEDASSQTPIPAEQVLLPLPGSVEWGGIRLEAGWAERFRVPDPRREAYFDGDVLSGPFVVRGPLPGDRVRPLGMRGSRRLQDVLVDMKVPAGRRAAVPLVLHEGVVVWVCGLLSAEQGRIASTTRRPIRLSVR